MYIILVHLQPSSQAPNPKKKFRLRAFQTFDVADGNTAFFFFFLALQENLRTKKKNSLMGVMTIHIQISKPISGIID